MNLSVQEKESQSTVNQLKIQELQDKVNSLKGSRDLHDPETSSSSGLSDVPGHPMSIPSPRGLLSHDSCLQPDTRNSYGTSGNVFEDLPAPSEGNSRSFAAAFYERVSLNTGIQRLPLIVLGIIKDSARGGNWPMTRQGSNAWRK